MSITTFAEVKTAIADYMARSDLTSYIPDFIIGAETRIAYGSAEPFKCEPLRIRGMETSADITVTSGSGSLPTGYLEARRLFWNGSPKLRLEQTSPEHFYGTWMGSTSGSNPTHYIIEGDSIIVGQGASGTIKMIYYKKFDPLATASPVPWLLTNAPHVYVYGALLEAAPFIRNDPRLQVWYGLYKSAVEGLNRSSQRDRWSGSAMSVRNDVGNP